MRRGLAIVVVVSCLFAARVHAEDSAAATQTSNQGVTYERRWSAWVPWAVVGAGVLGVAAGFGLQALATSNMDEYDRRIAADCAVNGCNLTNPQTPQEKAQAAELNGLRDRARTEDSASLLTLGVGAGVLVAGVVLVVLNRPHAVRVDAHATAGGATASLGWDF